LPGNQGANRIYLPTHFKMKYIFNAVAVLIFIAAIGMVVASFYAFALLILQYPLTSIIIIFFLLFIKKNNHA
jgi:ABC-type glycerol-3-phosphate transport system permease component